MGIKIGLLVVLASAASAGLFDGYADPQSSYYGVQLLNNPPQLLANPQRTLTNQFFQAAGLGPITYPPLLLPPALPTPRPVPQRPSGIPQEPQVSHPTSHYNDAPIHFQLARLGAATPVLAPALTRLAFNPNDAGVAGTEPLVQPAIPTRVVYLPDVRTLPPPPTEIRPVYQPRLIQIPEWVPNVPTPIPARLRFSFRPLERERTRPSFNFGRYPYAVSPLDFTHAGTASPLELTSSELNPGQVYKFEYGVSDSNTGDEKSHSEVRRGNQVSGVYTLLEADGRKRTVHYTADAHNGFQAVVHRIRRQTPFH